MSVAMRRTLPGLHLRPSSLHSAVGLMCCWLILLVGCQHHAMGYGMIWVIIMLGMMLCRVITSNCAAGRMQDNEPLMRALSNLINLNEPDLTLFVGEALVGNDAVDQLTKFNQRLADLARTPTAQMIQGLVLTKMDTIDDKVRHSCLTHIMSSCLTLSGHACRLGPHSAWCT